MKKFEELKVYRIADSKYAENRPFCDELYICRGVAIDQMKCLRINGIVKEERVLYTGTQPAEGSLLWQTYDVDKNCSTSWYTSEEDAWNAAMQLNITPNEKLSAYLITDQIDPLKKEFPVNFQLDHNGRPYVRFDPHPERDGHSKKGKIFFPDRSFVGADAGYAMVSISKEFDTYGFLTGKMSSFESECPSMKEFLDWAWENEKSDRQVLFINHPGRGRYIAITDNTGDVVRIVRATYDFAPDQHVWRGMKYDEIVKMDAEQYTERKCTLTQLYLEDAWGMEVDLDAILKKFDDASFLWNAGNIWEPSIKFWGSTIDTARKNGFLKPYCVPGKQIEAIDVVPERLDALSYLTREEVREMITQVNKINAAAKEKLLRLLKKA